MLRRDVIETIYAAAQEHYAGLISSNEAFARIYASQKDFRDRNYLYHRAADYQYDTTNAHAPAQALTPQPSVPLGAGVGAPDEGVER
jgi:hypothetical protein